MFDSQMTETVRDKAIITSEFIRVNETSALHLFDNHRDESLTEHILNDIHPDFFTALRDAEHRDLTGSPATTVFLYFPVKVRLIHLDLPGMSE
ncbi:MAG: hypothetical protein WCF90_06410 [Methanomicrobiales archaeon]